MLDNWLTMLWRAVSVPGAPPDAAPHEFARYDLGVCPGCRGLRSASSLRCAACGSTRPVAADA